MVRRLGRNILLCNRGLSLADVYAIRFVNARHYTVFVLRDRKTRLNLSLGLAGKVDDVSSYKSGPPAIKADSSKKND